MGTTRFTEEEVAYLDNQAHMFVERDSNWRRYIPFETIPWARKSEWKVIDKIHDAAASLDGSRTNLAASAYTWDEAMLVWFGHHFEWSELEVEIARRTGNQISTDEIRLGYRRIDQQIERMFFQGAMTWEPSDVVGCLANATDVGGTVALDAVYWNTPLGGPYTHAMAGFQVLTTAGYDPPFTWVLGENLRTGLAAKDNDYSDRPSRALIAEAFDIDQIEFVGQASAAATKTDTTIYPLPAPAADDARWVMFKADRNNAAIQEVFPPKLTIVSEMDIKRRMFYGRLDWFGTVKIVHDDSFVDEDQVDLVA